MKIWVFEVFEHVINTFAEIQPEWSKQIARDWKIGGQTLILQFREEQIYGTDVCPWQWDGVD